MPSVFNILRASVYCVVLIWTIICLAIAVHFSLLLATNDITRFIPFAIFVCCATSAILAALLLFGFKKANPISTRIELGCLGLTGIIWLVLVSLLFTSDAASANVECHSPGTTVVVNVPGFSTETFRAQYHVLEAFSGLNVFLILGFLILLLSFAVRHHLRGDWQVWLAPVTAYPWFYRYPQPKVVKEREAMKLPPPVTLPVDRSKAIGAGALEAVKEKPSRDRRGRESSRNRQQLPPATKYTYKHGYWLPERSSEAVPLRKASERSGGRSTRDGHDRYLRDASPRR